MGNLKVKVIGDRKAVEQFLSVLEKTFALMLKSKLIDNGDDDNGVHCFIDLDAFALKEASP